jgi:CHAT domain-containing protein
MNLCTLCRASKSTLGLLRVLALYLGMGILGPAQAVTGADLACIALAPDVEPQVVQIAAASPGAIPSATQRYGQLVLQLVREGRREQAAAVYLRLMQVDDRPLEKFAPTLVQELLRHAITFSAARCNHTAIALQQRAVDLREKDAGLATEREHPAYLNNLGQYFRAAGQNREARTTFEAARRALDQIDPGRVPLRLTILEGLALSNVLLQDGPQALAWASEGFQLASAISGGVSVGNPALFSQLKGLAYRAIGDLDKALASFRDTMRMRDALSPEVVNPSRIVILTEMAITFRLMGDLAGAHTAYGQALSAIAQLQGPNAQINAATVYSNRAVLLHQMGRMEDARTDLEASNSILSRIGPEARLRRIVNYKIAARIDRSNRNFAAAESSAKAAIELSASLGATGAYEGALAHLTLASIELQRSDSQQALERLEKQARPILEARRPRQARDLLMVHALQGLAFRQLRRYDDAIQALRLAQDLAESRPSADTGQGAATGMVASDETAILADELARTYAERNERPVAILWAKIAVNTIQQMRRNLASLDGEWDRPFVADRQGPYELLISLLVQEDRITEAQLVIEMLKRRELLDDAPRSDFLPRGALRAPLLGVEYDKFQEYYHLRGEQQRLVQRQRILSGQSQRTAQEERDLADINAALTSVTAATDAFFAALGPAFLQTKKRPEDPRNLIALRTGVRQLVDQMAGQAKNSAFQAAVVQHVTLEDRLVILVTLPSQPEIVRQILWKPESRAKHQQLLRRVLAGLRTPGNSTALRALQVDLAELHDTLIKPIEDVLRNASTTHLMLSPTGPLRYLPFASLYDKARGRYLIEDYSISVLNEAAIFDLEGKPKAWPARASWVVAGFGLTQAVDQLPALPDAERELLGVVQSWPGSRLWLDDGQKASPPNPFNLDSLRSGSRGAFDVVHIASHFALHRSSAGGSRLFLGDKTSLTLDELQKSDIRFDGVDLVVLSACSTAEEAVASSDGKPVESFAAIVQGHGAQAVVASLWLVGSETTSVLMSRFHLEKKAGVDKAQALRRTQINLLKPGKGDLQGREHPFYWAPFVLMGNWR